MYVHSGQLKCVHSSNIPCVHNISDHEDKSFKICVPSHIINNLCWMDNPSGRLSNQLDRLEGKYGDYMA